MLTIKKGLWYARPMVGGRRLFMPLGVPVRGTAPASLRDMGDRSFEQSRADARAAAERKLSEARLHDARWHSKMAELLSEVPRSQRPRKEDPGLPLSDLFEAWARAPHAKARSPRYMDGVCMILRRLHEWAGQQQPPIRYARALKPEDAQRWMDWLAEKKNAHGRTMNRHLIVARSVFKHLRISARLERNPFEGLAGVSETTIHRMPLSDPELDAVLGLAHGDVRGILVCGANTAMRLGDCCALRWGSVDVDNGFIDVRTHKSGARVRIPILPALQEELDAARRRRASPPAADDPVWPQMNDEYARYRQGVSITVQGLFVTAGIETKAARPGRRCANVKGFHALRTTWITKALSAGVPVELVRRVSGHSGVDVVMRHYYHPNEETFRRAIWGAFVKKKKAPRAQADKKVPDPLGEPGEKKI